MVVGSGEGFLALVDSDTGRVVRRLSGHRGLVYTPWDHLLVTGSDDNAVGFWSLPDGQLLGAPLRFRRQLFDTQLSPDGGRVTVSLVDRKFESGTVEVWDARSRRRARSVPVAASVGFARFSPDGRLLVVGNRFGRTQVWSTADWKPATRWLGRDASGIITAQISPNGSTLATGNDTGIVRLWDIPTEQAVGAPLPGGPNEPVLPFFTPDGTRLIASYQSGRAYVWDIRPGPLIRHACRVAGDGSRAPSGGGAARARLRPGLLSPRPDPLSRSAELTQRRATKPAYNAERSAAGRMLAHTPPRAGPPARCSSSEGRTSRAP